MIWYILPDYRPSTTLPVPIPILILVLVLVLVLLLVLVCILALALAIRLDVPNLFPLPSSTPPPSSRHVQPAQ
jgi:hypothetical protein